MRNLAAAKKIGLADDGCIRIIAPTKKCPTILSAYDARTAAFQGVLCLNCLLPVSRNSLVPITVGTHCKTIEIGDGLLKNPKPPKTRRECDLLLRSSEFTDFAIETLLVFRTTTTITSTATRKPTLRVNKQHDSWLSCDA